MELWTEKDYLSIFAGVTMIPAINTRHAVGGLGEMMESQGTG
jgi:hypothetical protein